MRARTRARSPRCGLRGEGLPILTVDEEIYRLLPSLVVATVDKLAQLPWHGYAGMLFGRVSQRCPRHGYRHDDMDERTGCGNRHNKRRPACQPVTSQPVTRLRPPDLIIQDELHLISGALGTTVGLFEAAVDELCGWPYDGRDRTRRPEDRRVHRDDQAREPQQARGLFGRDLAVFPPPVLDIEDTFFSRQVPVTPRDTRPPVPRHLRARRTPEVRRDPPRRDPADRRARRCSTRTARPPTRT